MLIERKILRDGLKKENKFIKKDKIKEEAKSPESKAHPILCLHDFCLFVKHFQFYDSIFNPESLHSLKPFFNPKYLFKIVFYDRSGILH